MKRMFFIGPISATEADPKWASTATKASIRESFKGSDGPTLSIGWMDSNQTGKRLIGCTWGIDARKGWFTQWPRAETMGFHRQRSSWAVLLFRLRQTPPASFEEVSNRWQGGDINEAIYGFAARGKRYGSQCGGRMSSHRMAPHSAFVRARFWAR